MEEDVKILKKLLNHKIFLDKFPQIKNVAVNQYGNGIDVVYLLADGVDYSEYKTFKTDAHFLVYSLAKMAGVKERLNIYPP